MKRNVTIHDVAQAAGVSGGTVHNALYGKKGVSDAVRKNILRISEELGYKPNMVASALKRKPRKIIVSFPSQREITDTILPISGRDTEGFRRSFYPTTLRPLRFPTMIPGKRALLRGLCRYCANLTTRLTEL